MNTVGMQKLLLKTLEKLKKCKTESKSKEEKI